ncbi:hypothetical protein LTR95_010426 [Oleoguttula sp. CCFEE 5521]
MEDHAALDERQKILRAAMHHPSEAVRAGPYMHFEYEDVFFYARKRFDTLQPPLPFYLYNCLGPRQIRLVELSSSRFFAAPLKCRLVNIDIDVEGRSYEAVSYTWGSSDKPTILICEGKAIPITQSLDAALRFFRFKYRSRPRRLWIDAVCINQDDGLEKESQIALMQEIYSRAIHSLIWLGRADYATAAAFYSVRVARLLLSVGLWVSESPYRMGLMGPLAGRVKVRFISGQSEKSADEVNQFFRNMLERPWFLRTWTIQELLLNRSAIFQCGRHSVSVRAVASYADFILPLAVLAPPPNTEHGPRSAEGQILLHYYSVSRKESNIQLEPLTLMLILKHALTSDPKDKVIGSQAILKKIGIDMSKSSSYNMSLRELYVDLTVSWISHWSDLSILSLVHSITSEHVDASDKMPSWPSWVVDWNDSERKNGGIVTDIYSRLV